MPSNSYRTIVSPAGGIYKEKGSRFLAFAYPVNSEIEIKEKIEALRKEYFDARHHCYAWVLGPAKSRFRSFDDGEPNHSAGDPILGKIRTADLTNILVVVVRYFGGVKLGVGGLIGAYKAAAEDALTNARVIEVLVTEVWTLNFEYETTSEIMRLLKEMDLKILSQDFTDKTQLKISVPVQEKEKLQSRFALMKALGKSIDWQCES
jgi:uncharacterized YigZ family protein